MWKSIGSIQQSYIQNLGLQKKAFCFKPKQGIFKCGAIFEEKTVSIYHL